MARVDVSVSSDLTPEQAWKLAPTCTGSTSG